MRRGIIIGLVVTGALLVILAVALATVGTQLDEARIGKEDLQFEVESLQQEVDALSKERETLQRQVDDQRKSLEQSNTELGRLHGQATEPAAAAPAAPDATSPAP